MRRNPRRRTLGELPAGYFDERYPPIRHDRDPAYHEDSADRPVGNKRPVDPAVYDEDGGPF